MIRNHFKRPRKECPTRLRAMPRRCAGWMRKGNDIDLIGPCLESEHPTDALSERCRFKELFDGQFPNRDKESGLENAHLRIQPATTIRSFLTVRYSIASSGSFAWKTAAHRGEVNPAPDVFLAQTCGGRQPVEQRATGCPCKGTPRGGFTRARGLTDENDTRDRRKPRDRGAGHPRA